MLRKSNIIEHRDAARKQYMEDEDYDKWTKELNKLYRLSVPEELIPVRDSIYVPMLNKLRHVIYEGHPKDIEVYKADKLIQQGKVPADDKSRLIMPESPFDRNERLVKNPHNLGYADYGDMPYIKGKAYPYNSGFDFLNELVARKPKAVKYLKNIHDAGYDISGILVYARQLSENNDDLSDITASFSDNVSPHESSYPDDTIIQRSVAFYPYRMNDKDHLSMKEILSNKDKFSFDKDNDYDALTNVGNGNALDALERIASDTRNDDDIPQDIIDKYANDEISDDEYNNAVLSILHADSPFTYSAKDEDAVNDMLSKYASNGIEILSDHKRTLPYGSPHLEDYIPLFLTDSDDPDDMQKSINDTLTDRRF